MWGLGPPTVSSRWPPGLACEARGAAVSKPPVARPADGCCSSPQHMARPAEGAAAAGLGQGVGVSLGAAPGPAAPSLDRAMRLAARRGSAVHSRHGGQWAVRRGLAGPGSSRVGGPHRLASRTLSWTPVFPDSCNSVLGQLGPLPHLACPQVLGRGRWAWLGKGFGGAARPLRPFGRKGTDSPSGGCVQWPRLARGGVGSGLPPAPSGATAEQPRSQR